MHYLWNGVISMGILNVALSVTYDGVWRPKPRPNSHALSIGGAADQGVCKLLQCSKVPTRVLKML